MIMKITQNVPHASNRYLGKFDKMTKDLFRKAQDKVKRDKLKEEEQKELDEVKRDKNEKILAQIQDRNRLKLAQQKARGHSGPSLREREQAKKQEQQRGEKELARKKIAETRMGRLTEDKSCIGLDQIDVYKLRAFREQKLQQQMVEEMNKRQHEAESLAKQRLRDRNVLNEDLIDFAHPDQNIHAAGQLDRQRRDSPEDEVAKPIVDKKQILREMKMKRKQE